MVRVHAARTLEELRAQFQGISEQAAGMAAGSDPASLTRRPMPESWSAAECLAHLNLSIDPYFPLWRRAFGEDGLTGSSPRERYGLDFWGRLLVWTLEPPPRFRFPTPSSFQPAQAGPFHTILAAFLERQTALLEVLEAARSVPIHAIRIASPFDGRVRYSLWSSFCVTAAHQRRHLWQAERAQALAGR